jgi:hypothetical protein
MHFVGQINRDCEVHPRSFALQGSAFSKRALNLTQPLQAKRRTSLTASVRQSAIGAFMTYSSTVPRDEWVGLNVALHRGRLLTKWLLAKALLVSSGRQLQFAIPCG